MSDIYSLVIPQAPYVIAAYGILWVGLLVFVAMVFGRLGKLERELKVVEEAARRRSTED
jgi:CcmD family protein